MIWKKTLWRYRILLGITLTLVGLNGCKESESVPFTDIPVIEGYLMPSQAISIKISRQLPFSSDVVYTSDNVDSLEIFITFDNQKIKLQSYGEGIYGDSSLFPEPGKEYSISFLFNDKQVSAYTYLPEKPENLSQSDTSIEVARRDTSSGFSGFMSQPEPVEITWKNDNRSYYLVLVKNLESVLDPIVNFGNDDPPGAIFRKSPAITSSESIRGMEFQYFGSHAIIVCHVLPDYASMYGDNSASSLNLTNPSSSISNGYGIFTGINADTLYLEVEEQ